MCLIVHNPNGSKLNKQLMLNAYDNNPHGFGLLWLNDDNELSELKELSNFNIFWSTLKSLEGYSYSFHLRWKTSGEINLNHCHPFKVLNKNMHGHDLYMFHNGHILGLNDSKQKSDSQIFSEILQQMYVDNFLNKDLLEFFTFIEKGKNGINKVNRFLFLTNNRYKIINKSLGLTIDNVWYSNYYSFIKGYRNQQKLLKSQI